MDINSEDYYVQLRTPALKAGDAQVGISYGLYLVLFGAILSTGVISTESPSMVAFRFADYLLVKDDELKHINRSELSLIKERCKDGELKPRQISDFADVFASMGIAKKPEEDNSVSAEEGLTVADVSYARYQALIKKLQEGSASAGDAARALRAWQAAGKAIHGEASIIISEIQFGFDLEGGEMNDDKIVIQRP